MTPSVEYGTRLIEFALIRRERSTLSISVDPFGDVVVEAPPDAADDHIRARVRRRARWILEQQRFFAQFAPHTPPRRWVPGETHLYLGRQYRLRIGDTNTRRQVRLIRGFLLIDGVTFDERTAIEHLVRSWYRVRAEAQFGRRVDTCRRRFPSPVDFTPAAMRLREMTSRWGSMSPNGILTLNPALVRAPGDAIDYVIIHELCHLAVPNHGRDFHEILSLAMPDWERRKLRLERALA